MDGVRFDPNRIVGELEERFGIRQPAWAVSLAEMKATTKNEPLGYSMRGYTAGRVRTEVQCYWLMDSHEPLRQILPENAHPDYRIEYESPEEIARNPYALAITTYINGRVVSIDIRATTLEPAPPPTEPAPPEPPAELSLDRLGAALEEIAGGQE